MSTFFEIAGIILLVIAIPTIIVAFLLLFSSLWLDWRISQNVKRFSKEREKEEEEHFNQKLAEELVKLKDDAEAQVCSEGNIGNNPHLVVVFDIINKDRKPIIKNGHNTVEVKLAEDRIDSFDYYAVLCELTKAVDRMASKGLATRLFYQRPVTAPQDEPCIPNRKGLVRNFEFRSYHSQTPISLQDSRTTPSTVPSH